MADVLRCPNRDALQRFLAGRLPEADTERLQQHLAHCPACVNTLHTLESEDSLIQAMRAQGKSNQRTEDDVVADLMAHLDRLSPPAPRADADQTQAYSPLLTTPLGSAPARSSACWAAAAWALSMRRGTWPSSVSSPSR
jgi:anti-sigma factor RsiW